MNITECTLQVTLTDHNENTAHRELVKKYSNQGLLHGLN